MKNKNVKTKFILVIFMLLIFSLVRAFGATCGDVDNSGAVNIVDALLIAQYYVDLDPLDFDVAVADVNGDTSINIVDALLVAQFYVGLIDSFPGCPGTTPEPFEPLTVFAVNCGGAAYTASDGTEYGADSGFSGGTAYENGATVSGTSDLALYQTERYGDSTYSATVPNGEYLVTMHFAENYHTSAGSRIFDVYIEGQESVNNLDIFAEVGSNTAYVSEKHVTVTDREINIEFITVTQNAMINALKVTLIASNGDPVADFTISPSNPGPGDVITVDASESFDPDGSITTYHVDYGDGYTATGAVTTHQYTVENNYTITVTVTDNEGKTGVLGKTISIKNTIAHLKPRIVVLTDLATNAVEPDDTQSMIRLLAHADMLEIEAICWTTGYSWGDISGSNVGIDIANQLINAYEMDLPNMMKRSGQVGFAADETRQEVGYWPSPAYLRSVLMKGSLRIGRDKIGAANDSPGSNKIIQLADENDDRRIFIQVWGGGNTAAQSIYRVKTNRSAAEFSAFLKKIWIYTITDQDRTFEGPLNTSSHGWMREQTGSDFMFIWDECSWKNHNNTGNANWTQYETHIQGHGNLGTLYPKYRWGTEGDTPSMLFCMPTGINNPEDPSQAGWVSQYYNSGNNLWRDGECNTYFDRFYGAAFNNFAARMDWAANGSGNRNPIIVLDDDDGYNVIMKTPRQGTSVTLDASKTYDPDGNNLTFTWWIQPEAGSYSGSVTISNSTSSTATVSVPSNSAGSTFHVICEVKDNGTHNLSDYRRIIFQPTN